MDGLTHPSDLEAWHRWQHGRQPLTRRARAALDVLRDIASPDGRAGDVVLARGGPRCRLLVLVEARTTSQRMAVLAALAALPLDDVVVVSPASVHDLLPPWPWAEKTLPANEAVPALAREADAVLSTGHYLPLGRLARGALEEPGRFVTVQHGLLTPHAPPLAAGCTLAAWSTQDADFWRSGRTDVSTVVVGSQLLWEASQPPPAAVDPAARPVFLGQLHGAELPTTVMAQAAESFCRAEGAVYRPHPAEVDRRSRATHRRWEAEGITVDRSGTPLRELGAPVVGVFSTGVLEAAAAGLPAHVFLPDPPSWVREFWSRHDLRPWGGPPTPSPERPEVEPSRALAEVVRGMMAG